MGSLACKHTEQRAQTGRVCLCRKARRRDSNPSRFLQHCVAARQALRSQQCLPSPTSPPLGVPWERGPEHMEANNETHKAAKGPRYGARAAVRLFPSCPFHREQTQQQREGTGQVPHPAALLVPLHPNGPQPRQEVVQGQVQAPFPLGPPGQSRELWGEVAARGSREPVTSGQPDKGVGCGPGWMKPTVLQTHRH